MVLPYCIIYTLFINVEILMRFWYDISDKVMENFL